MKSVFAIAFGLLLSSLALLTGCAAARGRPDPAAGPALPGVSAYYAEATAHPRRAVRKPVRDKQEYALSELARSAETLLAESRNWDAETRLVALTDDERTAERAAVQDLRASLEELKTAAKMSDIAALRAQYARATAFLSGKSTCWPACTSESPRARTRFIHHPAQQILDFLCRSAPGRRRSPGYGAVRVGSFGNPAPALWLRGDEALAAHGGRDPLACALRTFDFIGGARWAFVRRLGWPACAGRLRRAR